MAPFILRGVTLAGIDSVMAPKPRRIEAWKRLARDLDRAKLAAMTGRRSASDVIARRPTSSRARCAAASCWSSAEGGAGGHEGEEVGHWRVVEG